MVEHSVKQGIPKIDKQLTPSINKLALYLTCGKEQKTTTNKQKKAKSQYSESGSSFSNVIVFCFISLLDEYL